MRIVLFACAVLLSLSTGVCLGIDFEITDVINVGPVYSGRESDSKKLQSSYYRSLELASRNGIKSISFPSISTGIFGYPVSRAAGTALNTIIDYLKKHPDIELVRMVLFSESDYKVYRDSLEGILSD